VSDDRFGVVSCNTRPLLKKSRVRFLHCAYICVRELFVLDLGIFMNNMKVGINKVNKYVYAPLSGFQSSNFT
jgi:hypothetical protein